MHRRLETVLPQFLEFCEGAVMVAHNADFDMSFIIENCKRQGLREEYTDRRYGRQWQDFFCRQLNRFKLDTVAKAVGVSLEHHHRAVDDAACTAEIFVRFVEMLEGAWTFQMWIHLNKQGNVSVNTIKKLTYVPCNHPCKK